MIRHLLAPDEKVPHWYTNAIPRKYSEFLVNGLVSIKVQTFEATNGLVWLAAGLILVSGLYWLGLYAFREVKKHRARSSSSSSQTPD